MRSLRRYGALLVTAGLIGGLVPSALPVSPARAAAAKPSVTARSAAVYDRTAHKWRYLKQARTRRPVASITKVMTAYVVLKNAKWKKKVTISKAAVNHAKAGGASSAGFRAGEKVTLGQAMYAMLLPSGADVAYQLAHDYGPGSGRFVKKMNAYARKLNMTKTRYVNQDGLPNGKSQYSTAVDQLKLMNAVLKSTTFRKVVRTKTYHLKAGSGHRAHTWTSTNRLLGGYKGANGIKTGTTNAAGFCLAFSAYRSKHNLIGIVLHSSSTINRFSDATKLLNYTYGLKTTSIKLRALPTGVNPD